MCDLMVQVRTGTKCISCLTLCPGDTLVPSPLLQFFQQNQGQENQQDMINFAMIALALYGKVFGGDSVRDASLNVSILFHTAVVYKGFSVVVQL